MRRIQHVDLPDCSVFEAVKTSNPTMYSQEQTGKRSNPSAIKLVYLPHAHSGAKYAEQPSQTHDTMVHSAATRSTGLLRSKCWFFKEFTLIRDFDCVRCVDCLRKADKQKVHKQHTTVHHDSGLIRRRNRRRPSHPHLFPVAQHTRTKHSGLTLWKASR